MAKGSFTAASATQNVILPFAPDYVELINYTNMVAAATANKCLSAVWDASLTVGANNPTVVERYDNSGVWTGDVIATNGISVFSKGEALKFGPQIQISGITEAAAAVVTTASSHGFVTGDVVTFQGLYQSATTGMPQLDGMPFTVTVTGATTFTIPWATNQSNFDALSGSPTGAFVKKVLNPYLYFPGVSFISAITTGSTTTISTTNAHNLVAGQLVGFRIPDGYGTTSLNDVTGYVTSVTDYNTVVVNVNSSSFTAFNSNQTVASVPGLSFPQMVALGDVNTGGVAYSGGDLYPSPQYLPAASAVNTINGPAIKGAFVNNSRQGFFIGNGATAKTGKPAFMEANDVILWRAFLNDYSSP